MSERKPALRLFALSITVLVACGAGVLAAIGFDRRRSSAWGHGEVGDLVLLAVYAIGILLVLSLANVLLRGQLRTLVLTPLLAIGTAAGGYAALALAFEGFWGSPTPWWNEPVSLLLLIGGFVPAVAVAGVWRRSQPRRRLDMGTSALASAALLVLLVPVGTLRLTAMSPLQRHEAAVREFGDLYLHAKSILDSCEALGDALPAGARIVVSPTANETTRGRLGVSGRFTFEYTAPNGQGGRIAIQDRSRVDANGAITYYPMSSRNGDYSVTLLPDDALRRNLPCPGPKSPGGSE